MASWSVVGKFEAAVPVRIIIARIGGAAAAVAGQLLRRPGRHLRDDFPLELGIEPVFQREVVGERSYFLRPVGGKFLVEFGGMPECEGRLPVAGLQGY